MLNQNLFFLLWFIFAKKTSPESFLVFIVIIFIFLLFKMILWKFNCDMFFFTLNLMSLQFFIRIWQFLNAFFLYFLFFIIFLIWLLILEILLSLKVWFIVMAGFVDSCDATNTLNFIFFMLFFWRLGASFSDQSNTIIVVFFICGDTYVVFLLSHFLKLFYFLIE